MHTNGLDWLAMLFAILGAVTWGILGLTGLTGDPINVVALALEPIFRPGPAETVEYFVYVLVGLSGVYLLYTAYKMGRSSRRETKRRRREPAPDRDRESAGAENADH
ncbi:DUF378 domain-containing protein [Halorussus marinus]|uniref:DUF378 domain-containing protein n=1 Tax=Halorussus marinus TaxID=2505976 RepID=UPI00106E8B18|nr:DUF378 domain-containing protein [Halorussus marinus]